MAGRITAVRCSRRLALFSAAVLAVLAVVLPVTIASAASAPAATTRVGAHHPGMIFTVGAPERVPAGEGRDTVPSQPQFVSGACVAAEDTEDTMAGVRAAGSSGEQQAGIIKNTDRIPSLSGTAAYRIPDELNSSVLGEVKNVSNLSFTNQLQDFSGYAQQEQLQFNLYVRGSTTLSGPLQAAVDSGDINLLRILSG
jgi:hypothetical protein